MIEEKVAFGGYEGGRAPFREIRRTGFAGTGF